MPIKTIVRLILQVNKYINSMFELPPTPGVLHLGNKCCRDWLTCTQDATLETMDLEMLEMLEIETKTELELGLETG